MQNFQGIAFIWTQTYREIFKSPLCTFNLKQSIFHSSKLIKNLMGKKSFIYISLLWSKNKVQRFFFQKTKWGKPEIIRVPKWTFVFWKLKVSITTLQFSFVPKLKRKNLKPTYYFSFFSFKLRENKMWNSFLIVFIFKFVNWLMVNDY